MTIKIQKKAFIFFIFVEVILLLILFSFFPKGVFAGVGEDNVTMITNLTVGNVFPEMFNVSVENNASSVALTPNATKTITCVGLAVDYNGWDDIASASAQFFDNSISFYGDSDDNNYHYTNSSCTLEQFELYSDWVNCTFEVEYYANAGTWNCTIFVNDTQGKIGYGYDLINISTLLALGLPDFIDYGTVNATEISGENVSNVTNFGNVMINLSLSGYGFTPNDGNAMNCTIGYLGNISIELEKYNLTNSNPGVLNLAQFVANYTNLTSAPVVKKFNLNYRQNDTSPYIDDTNTTYWRIYVPQGVGGTCQGNVVFGATVAPGT